MPKGSATTNNALEALNSHTLQSEMSAGNRYTIAAELIQKRTSFISGRSSFLTRKLFPITSFDLRSAVFVTSQRRKRVKNWFQAANYLNNELLRSNTPLFIEDSNEGFFICSEKYRKSRTNITELLCENDLAFSNLDKAKGKAQSITNEIEENIFEEDLAFLQNVKHDINIVLISAILPFDM